MRTAALLVSVLAVGLVGCQGEDDAGERTSSSRTSHEKATDAGVDPATGKLRWSEVPGSTRDTVTRGGEWTLRVASSQREATLEGPSTRTVRAPDGWRVSDALLDREYAVVVVTDEQARRPDVATVVDLATDDSFELDGDSDVPTTTGGTWALGEGRLLHATVGEDGAYCLADVDLSRRTGETSWCAPDRNGFNGARITADGTTLLTFDDQRPSCRTAAQVVADGLEPLPHVKQCAGWDSLLLDGQQVWSTVAKERRVEEARFFATDGDRVVELGPGTSGSLVACGRSAYFVRDPQRVGDPARLMRWDGREVSVAYESSGRGPAFLTEPRCGGDTLTVTSLGEAGDEQVAARVR